MTEKTQLPLRGVAMILLAVAFLLVGWGVFSLTNKAESPADSASVSTPTTTPLPASGSQQAQGGHKTPASLDAPAPAPQPAESEQPPAAPAAPAAPAPNPSTVTVNVLNNSTITGLGSRVQDRLAGEGYVIGHVGNIDGAQLTVPHNTVFFSDNEAAARALADRIGAVAVPRVEGLPENYVQSGALAVVLAGEIG